MQKAQNFFSNKNFIVQAEGVQGTLYKVGSYFQLAGSAGLVANTLALPMKGFEIMWNS
jgi:N-acetyl-beta-hexosaminidase